MRGVEDKNFLKRKDRQPGVETADRESYCSHRRPKRVHTHLSIPTTRHAGTAGVKVPQMSLSRLHARDVEFSHQGQ